MNRNEISGSTPAKIGAFYVVWLVAAVLLCVRLVGAQTILEHASENRPYSVLFGEYYSRGLSDDGGSAKVICFGDSTSFLPPDETAYNGNPDVHMPGLIRLAVSRLETERELKFSEWAFPASYVFDYYCLYYEALKFSPDLIIIPLNWKCFGSDFIHDPRWFHPELSALAPLRAELPSGYENPVRARGISWVRQLEYRIGFYSIYSIGIKNWAVNNMRVFLNSYVRQFVPLQFMEDKKAASKPPAPTLVEDENAANGPEDPEGGRKPQNPFYPMAVERSNPTFRTLRAFAHVASKRGTKVLFYIWPMNQEFFAHIEILDKPALDRSRRLVVEAIRQEGVPCVDLSDLLEHKYFSDPHGHCTVKGRWKIAEALAPEVLELLRE